jgi:hypothetical protein
MQGSLKQMAEDMVWSFQQLNPAEQEQLRKDWYEKITGKPYREKKL